MPPLRVVYFTRAPIYQAADGGQLCNRLQITELANDPDIDLSVIAAGPAANENGTVEFFRAKAINGRFVPYSEAAPAMPWLTRRWPYHHEIDAKRQTGLDAELAATVARERPDFVVIGYLPSAFFVPSVFALAPVVPIALNREAEFYRDLVRHGVPIYGKPGTRIGALRMWLAETMVHLKSRAVVSIGKNDRPRRLLGRPLAFHQPPVFDANPEPWAYAGKRTLFFVGMRGHFPNNDAIEWLATKLAPELDPSIEIKILGAEAGDVPESWRRPNVHYLGGGDRSTLETLCRSAVFIAPVENTHGAKMKVAEAISFGTPLLAPESALSGVPFLPWLPRIRLDRPPEAAAMALALVNDADAQRTMSARILADANAFRQSACGSWGRLLRAAHR